MYARSMHRGLSVAFLFVSARHATQIGSWRMNLFSYRLVLCIILVSSVCGLFKVHYIAKYNMFCYRNTFLDEVVDLRF